MDKRGWLGFQPEVPQFFDFPALEHLVHRCMPYQEFLNQARLARLALWSSGKPQMRLRIHRRILVMDIPQIDPHIGSALECLRNYCFSSRRVPLVGIPTTPETRHLRTHDVAQYTVPHVLWGKT